MDPRSHRADRDPERVGRLLVGQFSERLQEEGAAIHVRQCEERFHQLRSQTFRVEPLNIVGRRFRDLVENRPSIARCSRSSRR